MDTAHLWQAARYVDLNPVRAGLVAQPEAWPWSSARSRILGGPDPLLAPDCPILEAVE
jgi:putative transposase